MRVVLTGNTCFSIANFRQGLVRTLIELNHEVHILAPFDSYRDRLAQMGCYLHDLPLDRSGTSPLSEFRVLWYIFRFLRRSQPDFVLGYTIKNNIYCGLVCRWLGIPFIANITGLGATFQNDGLFNRIIRSLYRVAFQRAKAVFFQNSEDKAEFVLGRLIRPPQARILRGSGVDLAAFKALPMPKDTDNVVFILVARLLWDKGIGLYVDAARRLREYVPNTEFHLLGPLDNSSRSAIPADQIYSWHQQGLINYLGATQDVRPALAMAHCVVLPSWYREGTPRTLLEAAATGRAVITTNTPGCRDVIELGVTGFLCEPQDADSLHDAMQKFSLMTAAARAEMGCAARKRAEKYFDEEVVINAYLNELYIKDCDQRSLKRCPKD